MFRRILALLLLMLLAQPADLSPRPADELSFLPEVRLRKIHLVRPDLIPFPVAVEIVC